MERILVVGVTGAGKSTLARALGGRLRVPYHEMDALYFDGPGWAVNAGLVEDVARLAAGPRWIVDSLGYPDVRDLLWERADTVVWLDYPRRVVMPRVLRRSVLRTVRREELFGGNRETWRSWLSREHPAWWSWSQHAARRREIGRRVDDARFAPLATPPVRASRGDGGLAGVPPTRRSLTGVIRAQADSGTIATWQTAWCGTVWATRPSHPGARRPITRRSASAEAADSTVRAGPSTVCRRRRTPGGAPARAASSSLAARSSCSRAGSPRADRAARPRGTPTRWRRGSRASRRSLR